MARGHHYRRGGAAEEEEKEEREERKEGGKVLDYTAESNVIPEAKGARRKRGGAVARKDGGATTATKLADGGTPIALAHGGRAKKHVGSEGHASHRRHDRPGRGRKRGGGIGSDMTPLTTAARTREAGVHKADADELDE